MPFSGIPIPIWDCNAEMGGFVCSGYLQDGIVTVDCPNGELVTCPAADCLGSDDPDDFTMSVCRKLCDF